MGRSPERPPLEEILDRVAAEGAELEGREGRVVVRGGEGVKALAEALRPYREELARLLAPYLGKEEEWEALLEEARKRGREGRIEVHLTPLEGFPLAVRAQGARALERAVGAVKGMAFREALVVVEGETVAWRRSLAYLGDEAPLEEVEEALGKEAARLVALWRREGAHLEGRSLRPGEALHLWVQREKGEGPIL